MKYDVPTSVWGREGWVFIESIIRAYPKNPDENLKDQMFYFLHSLAWLLPCAKCRENYTSYINRYPVDSIVSHKIKLAKWVAALKASH